MSAVSSTYAASEPRFNDHPEARRWFFAGLTVLLVLVAIAVGLSIVSAVFSGQVPYWSTVAGAWGWVPGVIAILVTIWVAAWVFRIVFWDVSGAPYHYPYWRQDWRQYHRRYRAAPPYGVDPAVETARLRFARGEISKEQLDQIVQQLGRGSGPLPP